MNLAEVKVYEDIYSLASKWLDQDFKKDFLVRVLELARKETPFYKMLLLWEDSTAKEREEIVADLEEMVSDFQELPMNPIELPYVKMEKLNSIASEIKNYKKFLKDRVAMNGGVSQVALRCKMTQPSLSRFLNTTALPRKSTLEKLAKALNLTQEEMVFEWTK